MAPLLKISISLVLVATSALLALDNAGTSAIAVSSPASDLVTDVKTPTAHLANPTATPALLPIGTTTPVPAPAEKEQDPSKIKPIASEAKSPAEIPTVPMTPIHRRPYQFPPPARPQDNIVANQKRAQPSSQWSEQWDQSQWPGQQSQWPGQQSQWPGQQSQYPGQSQWGSTPSFGSRLSKPKKRAVADGQDPSGADAPASDARPFGRIGAYPMTASTSSSGYMSPSGPSLRNSILCHYDSQSKNTIYCSDGRVYQTSRGRPPRDVFQGQPLVKRAVGDQPPQLVQPQPQYAPKVTSDIPKPGQGRGQDPRVTVPSPQQKRLDTDSVRSDFYTTIPVPIDIDTLVYPDGQMVLLPSNV